MPGMQGNGMGYWVMPGMQGNGMGYAWNAVSWNGLCLECSVTEWVMPGMQCNGMGYAWNAG